MSPSSHLGSSLIGRKSLLMSVRVTLRKGACVNVEQVRLALYWLSLQASRYALHVRTFHYHTHTFHRYTYIMMRGIQIATYMLPRETLDTRRD